MDDEKWVEKQDKLQFLLAGFVVEKEGAEVVKPDFGAQAAVSLKPRKNAGAAVKAPVVVVPKPAAPVAPPAPAVGKGAGNEVGFINGDEEDDDDELIDEDELMADENLATPVQMRKPYHLPFAY